MSTDEKLEAQLVRMFDASRLLRTGWELARTDGHALRKVYPGQVSWNARLYNRELDYVMSYDIPADGEYGKRTIHAQAAVLREMMAQAFEYAMLERAKQ